MKFAGNVIGNLVAIGMDQQAIIVKKNSVKKQKIYL